MKKNLVGNYRPYTIHFNLEKSAKPLDILRSYYLGRLIDENIQNGSSSTLTHDELQFAKRRAEWQLSILDMENDLIKPLENEGWSLDFIYLDDTNNRFSVTTPEEVLK